MIRMNDIGMRGIVAAFVLGPLVFVACKSSAPSKEEIDRLIDQRLAERGLAPLPSASAAGSASAAASAASAGLATDPAAASLAFLARLDDLMKDYSPQLPAVDDKTDTLRCLTSDAVRSSPDLQKASATLKKRTDAAKQERKRKEAEFYGSRYALGFHYDLDWQTRKGAAVPAEYECFGINGWMDGYDEHRCTEDPTLGWEWKLKFPGHPAWFVYTNSDAAPTVPPELMHRMEAAGIKPPARFTCRVDDVLPGQGQKTIKCSSSGISASIRVSGEPKPLNVGDLVSVPLANTKRDPDGVLVKNVPGNNKGWVIDADGSTLTVDAAATCPSMTDILAGLGNSGGK